jgi:eukaryotic-like serine/threonine-protein kinase
VIYATLGQYDKSAAALKESQGLEPSAVGYLNLAQNYLYLNRVDDARKTIEEAQQKKFDADFLHMVIYLVAFVTGDAAEMERQVAWAAGKP